MDERVVVRTEVDGRVIEEEWDVTELARAIHALREDVQWLLKRERLYGKRIAEFVSRIWELEHPKDA